MSEQLSSLGLNDQQIKPAYDIEHYCIVVQGRVFAVNLLWGITTTTTRQKARNEIRMTAQNLDTNLYCLYPSKQSKKLQYGFANELKDHQFKMEVLAPYIAEQVERSFLGIWQTESGAWVMVGINDEGQIILDKILFDDELAKTEFMVSTSIAKWKTLACPTAWGFSDTIQTDLSRYLTVKKKFCIQWVTRSYKKEIVSLLMLLLISIVGYQGYLKFFEQRPKVLVVNTEPPPPMPWLGQSTPQAVLQSCSKAIRSKSLIAGSIPGWSASSQVSCDGQSVVFQLSRDGGTLSWLQYLSQTIPKVTLSVNGDDSVQMSWPVESSGVYVSDHNNDALSQIKAYLTSAFAEAFTPIDFDAVQQQPYWESEQFHFSTTQSPFLFLPIMDKVNGLVITSVSYDNNTWVINGTFYAKNQ